MGAIKNLILGKSSDKKKKKQVSTKKQNSTLLNESKLPKATKSNKPVSSTKKTTSQQKNYSTAQDYKNAKKSAVTTTKKALNQTQKALDKQTAITRREVSNRGITPGNNTFSAPNMFTQRNKTLSDSRAGKVPVLNRNNNAKSVTNREKSEAANINRYQQYATSNEGKKQIAKTQEAKDYRNIARSNYETAKADYDYTNASNTQKKLMTAAAPIRGGFSTVFKSDNSISGKTANKEFGLDANASSVRLPNYSQSLNNKISENSKGFAKFYNDVTYSLGGRATLGALNNLAPGLGTAANAINDVEESYNDAILQGKKHSQATKYSIGQSALNYAFDKFGSGKTSGMKSEGALEKVSNKTLGKIKPMLNKVIGESKSAAITDYISTMGAEGAEEFIQSFFDKMNANLTLDNEEYIFSKESIKDAFYQGLGGILGAGLIGSGRLIHNSNSKNINNLMLETKSNLDKVVKKVEESGTELNDAQKEMIATTIISRTLRAENGEADKITDESLDRLSDTIINSTNNAETQQTAEQNIQTAPTNQDSVRANIEQTTQNEQNVRQKTEPQKSSLSEDEANELRELEDLPFDLDDSQEKRLNYLKAKQEGRIKYADLKTNNNYEDIKKDYNKYRNTEDFDASTLNAAKDFVPGYKNSERRTKQEWLEVARLMGSNLDAKNSEELTKYALQSWHATKPNQKDNLNRQGKKFVDFKVSDWVNEVYKGAGVGLETQAKPTKTNVENTDAIEYNKTGVDINERNQIADKNVTPKHFNKNQYDEAANYRDSFIENEGTSDSSFSNEKTKANSDMSNNTLMVKYEKGTEVKPTKPLSEDEKVAQILSEKPVQKQTIKEKAQATKEKTMRELVDKGYAFRRYENKEVYHKYDQILTASGSANYCLGEAQVDLKGNVIGKSLKDIWTPIEKAGKVEDFDLYYYNLLNIDRYKQGKPVFGENWTDEDSRNLVSELESKNPEFKEWAKDVQTYQHNLSQNLVDAGLLSKKLKEQFDTQNEYYAKIIRVNSKNKAAMTQNMKGINISNTIRTAKGGNQDIMPLMYSMAQQTMEVFDAARWNDFGQELLKTKGGIAEGETLNVDTDEGTTLSTNKNGEDTRVVKDGDTYKMYVYQNGEKVAVELSEAEYEALAKSKFNDPENFIFSAIRNVNGVYRGLLTDKNPLFLFTNFFRDIGDAPFNSKYGGQFVGGYAEAIKQMSSNSELWKKYKGLGGASNSYFDTQKGINLSKDNTAKKALGAIEKMNMYVEQAPRFAEFLLTLKNGGTESEAMYNAAEVTTNFKRGGDLTKTLNRNGAIFLNASVQGFSKVVRNFTENGAKGATQMLAKACILGVLPSVLNQLSYDDDDDYNDLPDYIKDNYYVFKTDDKKFIRIPKGRAMAVFGMTAQRTINYLNGDKDAFKGLLKEASNNIAPNNPLENNMISPILAVKNNVSWNGSPIVSGYLKNDTYPEIEYDAKTDSLSKAIGTFFGVSPKKVNYLLDQYSGGVGDVLLPLITPQAHVNPISAKFTTNTINSNKNIDKFYTELNSYSDKKSADLSNDEDQVKYAYLKAVNKDIAQLKGELKLIQADTSLDNKTKLDKVNKIQQEINDRCKFALQDYETGYIESGSYAYVGEKEFYKDSSGSWHKVSADQQRSYNKYAAKYDITPGEYFSKAKITNDVIAGDKYEEYRNGVENARAKVEGTANKKAATIEYVNNLDLDIPQKAMLIRSYYSSFKSYDSDIINYLNENVEDERQRYLIEIQLGIIRK